MRPWAQTNFEPRGSAYQLFYLLSIIFYLFRVCLGILERPTLSGRAFRAGVRNRKRRMAIVKWCRLTPGGVSAVRGGNTALWMPYTAGCRGRRPRRPAGRCEHRPLRPTVKGMTSQAGCCLRGSSPSRRGTFYMRPSTGSLLRADMESAPTEPCGGCPYITRYRTACGCSRAAASTPRR